MFVVCFGDGLGNQMFQYAFYLEMKYRYPQNRILADIGNWYGSDNNHNGFELNKLFDINVPQCNKKQALFLADYHVSAKKNHPFIARYFALRNAMFGPKGTLITVDDPTEFYKEVFELNPLNSYMLRGNWVNEKYFEHVDSQIRSAFVFPDIEDENNKKLMNDIQSCESVSVHIRGGDYLTMGITSLDGNYYSQAISIVKRKLSSYKLFVFSDDVEYARKIIGNEDAVFVTGNTGANSFRDMQLMSMCKHNIIANSTFSFWGAYLNNNPDKLVLAPSVSMRSYNKPFACSEWELVKVDR